MINVVVDTNVVLDKTVEEILANFEEPTRLLFPLVVLEELDTFKKGFEPKNEYARAVNRFLDSLREEGALHEGVSVGEHIVQVVIDFHELDLNKPDYKIIRTAKEYEALLITQDINERVIADAVGVEATHYAPSHVNINELYTGRTERELTDAEVIRIRLSTTQQVRLHAGNDHEYLHNQFVKLSHPDGDVYHGIYKKAPNEIHMLKKRYSAWGVKPKTDALGNLVEEQQYLMHLLLDPEIQFISALGPSGTGKTLLTLAAALQQTIKSGPYKKVTVMRPLVAVGNDIGFLPGDKLEKLEPWMASTFDALEYLLEDEDGREDDGDDNRFGTIADLMDNSKEKVHAMIAAGQLELEAMAHIRGRSLAKQFLIIDDAQNLTQHEATTIITRAGEGTKVVFLGDLSEKQIDNHRLTPSSNGLAYVIDRFKGEDIVGHITLNTVVRSRLAQLGVEKL